MSVRRTVFMFSGQGSQYFHMGRALYERSDVFRAELDRLDAIATPLVGESVVRTLYDERRSKVDTFDRLALTSPAIFMVEWALARAVVEAGVRPDVVLGVSNGSFAAAVMAGALEPAAALSLLAAQSHIVQRHCQPGAMIAVLDDVQLHRHPLLQDFSEVAAVNGPSHFVISTPAEHVVRIESFLQQRGVTFQRLQVSFAFHSRWIDDAEAHARASFKQMAPRPLILPLACCAYGTLLSNLPPDYFWQVARRPIRLAEAIAAAESSGDNDYVDLGPSGTLAALMKYVLPRNSAAKVRQILSPFGREWENFLRIIG